MAEWFCVFVTGLLLGIFVTTLLQADVPILVSPIK